MLDKGLRIRSIVAAMMLLAVGAQLSYFDAEIGSGGSGGSETGNESPDTDQTAQEATEGQETIIDDDGGSEFEAEDDNPAAAMHASGD